MFHGLPSNSSKDITAIFKKYAEERSGPAKVASDSSREFADLIYDQVSHYCPSKESLMKSLSDLFYLLPCLCIWLL